MVETVSSDSLGISLDLSHAGKNIGAPAMQGRSGERALVNAFTGNLVVQSTDDRLVGRGLDSATIRTYNSQGRLQDDDTDNWTSGVQSKRLEMTGAFAEPGSRIVRTDQDGARATYYFDDAAGSYRSTDGAGAYDRINMLAGLLAWTDGDTGVTETYQEGGAHLLTITDALGNTVRYTWHDGGESDGLLAQVNHASGESILLDYEGRNLIRVRTVMQDGDATRQLTRVHYGYDKHNRLSKVTVDLTPEDNAVTDSATYATTYAYDGDSRRIAGMTQADGTGLFFTYIETGGMSRVASVTDAAGQLTRYAYDSANRRTSVIDALGQTTLHEFDSAGRLVAITAPVVAGVPQTRRFAYDSAGDMVQSVDAEGHETAMEYDAAGNQIAMRGPAGHTTVRTFDALNQLLTETIAVPAEEGAPFLQTTRYLYDSARPTLLRFTLSAEGRVTEYRYNSLGERIAAIVYRGATYFNGAPPADSSVLPAAGALAEWTAGQNRTLTLRTDLSYDFRGQLASETSYARVGASGNGIADGTQAVTRYVRDQAGQLLQSIAPGLGVTRYAWDGLGRLLSTTDALNQVSVNHYDDARNRTVVQLDGGRAATSVYDRAGRLAAIMVSNGPALNATRYFYDGGQRLTMTQDATGVRAWMLYDEAGRKIGDIDGDGSLSEYVYNRNDRIVRTISYATSIAVERLVDADGAPRALALADLRPAPGAQDRTTRADYDAANRLVRQIDARGAVTETRYDGGSRVSVVIAYATLLDMASADMAQGLIMPPSSTDDRITRNFYDGDGLLRATVDAEGFRTELFYDGAGGLTSRVSHGARTPAGELSLRTHYVYDGLGRLSGEIDAEGYLSEHEYDVNGNLTKTVRYADRVTVPVTPEATVAALRPPAGPADQSMQRTYDAGNRLVREVNAEGSVTLHTYDGAGNLVRTIQAAGTEDARTLVARHDAQGRVTAELSGAGAAMLSGAEPGNYEVTDALMAQYGTSTTYDAAGRRTSATDANGSRTVFYYDRDGRLTHTINALGEVSEQRYDTLGQRTDSIEYGTRIDPAHAVGGLVSGELEQLLAGALNPALDRHTRYGYDRNGRVASVTDALGNLTASTRDAFGAEVAVTETIDAGRSVQRQIRYDRRGLQIAAIEDPDGIRRTTVTAYDAFGRATALIDGNGNASFQEYDRLGRSVVRIDPMNGRRTTGYDAFGRVLSQTDATGSTTILRYDDTQRSVMVTTAEGVTTGVIHTRHGQTARVIDGRGDVTEYSYDKNGNLLQTRNALANSASRYDQANRLIETVDANGTRVAYRYDAANRLLRRQFDPDGLNLVSSFEYDAGGRQVTATDANGTVTQTRFDRKGQAVSQTVDPAGLRLETRYVYDARGKTLSVTAPDGVLTDYVYDDLGRRIEEHVDPAGLNLTRRYRHDANGNVIAITDANGNTRRQVHDASDRLAYAIDALGGVTRNEYDAEGRISRVTAYAQAIDLASLGAQPSPERVRAAVDAVASTAAPERDRVQRRFHDDDGRLEFTVDADGAVVRFSYDGNGNILRRTAYAIAVAPGMHPSSVAASAADRSTRMVYDHANRLVLSVDAQNGVTQQKFDGNGNLVMRIAYATPLAAGVSLESALSGAYEPGGETRITEIAYDRADRPVIEIDALGYVKQTRYDGVGRVVSGTRYAEALAAGAPGSRSALAAGLRPGMPDRTDMFRHDAGGRLTASTDALGLTELSTYDAGGNRLSFTNRKGATWRYQYDAAGRLLAETSPEVAMTAVAADGAGALAIAGQTVAALVTRIEHDALGNIVARTEAWGRPEQRTTRYRYDAVGRQIQTLYPAQAVYASAADDLAANGMNGPAVRTETTRQLSTETFYDALGNAVANRDVDGHLSYKAYDRLGRVAYDIDALGQVTAHTRNAFGEVTRLVRHEQAIAQDAVPTADLAAAGLGASDHDRVLLTSFDRLGRVLEVVEPAVFVHDFDAAMAARYEIAGVRTRNTYNAFGELVQVSRLKNALADNWTATTHYFDRGGHNVATVDALGYLSTRRHDGAGNVVELTEYTNALGAGAWNIDRHEMPAVSADDRIMRITYDLDDRKLGETRGSAADSRASSTIRHEYDALGNLTRTIDAAGGQTVSRYDALGRVISVAEPERGNTADGAPLTPLTTFLRDAHGNAVVRISHARGTAGAAAADAADRAELTQYDMVGHITQSTNANGVTRYFSYDARGQVAKTWQQVSGEDGVVRTLYEAFRYDQLGRLTRILAPAAGLRQAVSETALEYNAFGELTRKGLDGGRQEFFDYDNAGRIWRTNSGDGVDRIMLHDLHGNVTAELRSAGSARDDLDLRTVVSAAQAASLAAVRRTDMRYDALGRMIAQVQPERQTQQGGVDFHRAFSVGAVAASAVPVFDATGTANWFGTNRVTLSWSSLAALGSGDVKVVVDYLTRPYETGGDTLVDESGVLISPPSGHDAAARSRTAIHTAEQASSGISLSWDESVESYGKPGGISKVTGLTVYKKDVTGQWQSVIDQGRFGGTGNLIDLAAPADPSSLVMLALRRAGSAGDEGWTSQPLINFGDMLRFDASSLGVGSVEYRVFTTAPGQAARITASGILTLSAVPLAAISTPLSAGTAGPDLLTWQGPGELTEQILRYRVSGSDAGWNSLAVTARGNGQDGVNAAALAAGAYEFELLWSHAGDPAPYAHATGRLVVHGAAAGHDEMRNVAVRIPYTVTPPDPATYVTGWTGGPVYGPPVVIAHDAGGAEIFGPGYGRLIIGADESGNPIGGKVVAIPYQVYHAETRTETVQVVVPVQGEPIIIGHDESGASYYLRDESGNIIYRIISETRTETRTVEVQVPVTVTPADPALFLLSAHSGDPVYGPPVVLGHDEAGIPFYGPGYRMIDGQVRAIPYTATRTEMQMQKVWIATPGLMRSYAATVDTGAASAAASLGSATAVPAQAARIDGETRWNRPVVEQKVDRWGNVLEITDARNGAWTTRYGYNSASQLVRATGPDGAVTQYAYDALGRQTAVTDALGNVNSQVFDAGGNLVEERHADGGLIRYFYNAFGNRQMRIDAMGKTSTYAYDKLGQLLHIGRGSAAVYSADGAPMAVHQGVRAVTVSFSYDQAGRRLRQTNGNGEATRSVYDLAGNVLETILPSGHGTRNAYDAQRRKTSETDANGNTSTWSYDYFGQLQSHTDLGGASYRYEYDHARQLVGQSNTRGQDLRYVYDAVGQLVQVRDNALNQQTSIAYDAGGRRIREKTVQNGVVYQDNHLGYDAAGRLRTVDDGRVGISLDYDKAGNRTRIRTHTIDLAGASHDADRWFAYDAMNRQILIDGAVNGNAADDANLVAGQGHRVVYDANGNRISDMSWGRRIVQSGGETTTWLAGYDTGAVDESGKPILVAAQPSGFDESGNPVPGMRDESGGLIMLPPVYRTTTTPVAYDASMGLSTEVYGYDALDRLSGITRDGVVVDNRFYDGADRVVQSGPLAGLAQAYTNLLNGNIIGNGSEIRTNRFDADGRLLHQRVAKSDGEAKYDIDYGTYDAAGNLRTYTMQTHGEKGFTGSYDYSHSRFEGYREGAITGSRSDNPGVAGVTVNSYDVNGNLIAISDSTEPAANRRFINDSAGRALYSDQDGHVQRQLVVDGEVLGRYGDIADQIGSGSGKPVFISQADFNFGYRPVSANYPGAGAGSYQAAAGDTLQSIAQGAYGDSRLWHLIAEANGLSGSRDLRVGQTLTVPNRVGTIHNDASSFRPYDQSRIAGDTTPNLPAPQHGDHGCGGFGQILVVIVAIVVTVYTAGAMAGPAGATLGGTMTAGASVLAGGAVEIGSLAGGLGLGAAGTAAVAGAAGSMASQGVGVALGTQDGFDWKGVALSALGAGVSAGVGSYFNRLAAADVPGLERAGAFASRAALGNAVTQGVGVAAGLQDRFSWRNVASAAAGMAVGDAVSGATGEGMHGGSEGFGDTLAQSGMSSTVAGVVAAVMRGGRIDMTRIAADAFGSALADSLVAQGSAMAGRQDRALGAAAGYTEEAYWNSAGKTVADRYAEVYGGQAVDIGDRPGFQLAAQDDEVVELTLPPVNVATPRMTAAEEAAFDAQNGTGSLRAMGPVDGFLAFNSFGRGLGGLGAGTARQVAGVAEGGMQAVLAVGDMVSFGMSHLDNMLGGNLRYAPHSGLGAATQMHGVGTTALNVLNGVITGTVQALMQPLSAAYRHDAYLFGESIPGALLAGAQFSRLANLSAAGVARARPDSLRALPGDAGHFGAKSVTPGGTGTALSGHGGKFLDDGYFVVPAGTSITLPRPDISILDRTGLIIEKGDWEGLAGLAKRDPRVAKDIDGMTTWLPGAKVPAYTLFEPDAGINLLSNSHSVYRPTPLQKILEPGLGYIQWAACTNFLSYTKY